VASEGLRGAPDEKLFEVCTAERPALITLDRDFGQVLRYPPAASAGIVILEIGLGRPMQPSSIAYENSSLFSARGRRMAHCGSSNPGVFESISHQMKMGNEHSERRQVRSAPRRGIEEQTRKLLEVCRLRDVPIITFVNELDREGRDPFDLLDEIEQFERGVHDRVTEPVRCSGLDDPQLPRLLPKAPSPNCAGRLGRGLPPIHKIIIQRAGISQHGRAHVR
jgi:hypothetical protein